jgi:hypothetical protein
MNNIVLFKSKYSINVEDNYNNFIKFCHYKLIGFTQIKDWDNCVWKGVTTFRKIGVGCKKFSSADAMHDEFANFAKAYIKYQHSLKPLKSYGSVMMALRCLEQALLQICSNGFIYNVTTIIFDEAMQIGRKHFKGNVLAQCGTQLERLSNFLYEHNLVKAGYIAWKNSVKQKVKNNYIPVIDDYQRKDKLPNESALLAIADIFSKDDDVMSQRDMFTSSVFALLLCCPSRISEILALPADCEIIQQDSKGIERYALRFYSVKGYGPNIKWIPQVMVPVAKKAVRRLRHLSRNARSLAIWCEDHPDEFYRHELCPLVDEKEKLTVEQVCHALGYPLHDKKACILKVKRTSLDGNKTFLNASDYAYTLTELWKMIRSGFSQDFPWFDKEKSIKYSNALCLLNDNQLVLSRMTNIYSLYKPTKGFFSVDMQWKDSHEYGYKNIFARYGFFDEEGKPLLIRSHQPRHLLNTIAHYGEMSELDISKWSGRVNVNQNRVYNHVSEEEMVEKVGTIDFHVNSYCHKEPNSSAGLAVNLNDLQHGAIHLTERGYCIHDYAILPCEKINQYIESYNHLKELKPTDKNRLLIIRDRIIEFKRLTQVAFENDDYGAEKWIKHHELNLNRINNLLGN